MRHAVQAAGSLHQDSTGDTTPAGMAGRGMTAGSAKHRGAVGPAPKRLWPPRSLTTPSASGQGAPVAAEASSTTGPCLQDVHLTPAEVAGQFVWTATMPARPKPCSTTSCR